MTIDFHGAKIALLLGKERLLAYQRDDKAGIPFPGALARKASNGR